MEDVKWLFRKCGFPILILLFAVIAGVICWGKLVDYTENADGTITLIVDGVWPDYNSNLAFRNTVVVQPFEDGTFRYLSNSIEQIELELPPIAKAH